MQVAALQVCDIDKHTWHQKSLPCALSKDICFQSYDVTVLKDDGPILCHVLWGASTATMAMVKEIP